MAAAAILFTLTIHPWGQDRRQPQARGEAGVFDFYVLSLSWSPQYCAQAKGAAAESQCAPGKRYGFVVHGLWPQYERGWPQNCSPGRPVDPALAQRLLPIMPSRQLIQHEWTRHGTCSGLTQEEYFRTIEKVFRQIRIPELFRNPVRPVTISSAEIKEKFRAANDSIRESSLRTYCSGRYFSELRLCYDRSLQPRPCPASLRDGCRSEPVLLPPVR